MSRPLRIQFPAAVYHVMNRGAARQQTFVDDGDSQAFLDTVGEAHRLWGIEVFAYSLMYLVDSKVLLEPGRQRQWVAPRAQLVYLAREWCGLTAKELAARLNRDASMISRLYGWYQGHRDQQTEEKLAGALAK